MLNCNSEIANKVLSIVEQKLQFQVLKGVEKYGQTLDECGFDEYDFLNMALEETVDGMQYLLKEIFKLKAENRILKGKSWFKVNQENLVLAQENASLKEQLELKTQAYEALLKSI